MQLITREIIFTEIIFDIFSCLLSVLSMLWLSLGRFNIANGLLVVLTNPYNDTYLLAVFKTPYCQQFYKPLYKLPLLLVIFQTS